MSKPPKFDREIPSEGTHKGTLVYAIDLGTQPNKNPDFEDAHKVQLGFELSGRKRKDGKPFVVSTKYTFTMSVRGNYGKMLKRWLGVRNAADFDLVDALGKSATLDIEHSKDGQYANIVDISKYSGPRLKTETKPYSLFLDDTFDPEVFNGLWDKIKETIAASPEYEQVATTARKPRKKKGKR